MLIAVHHDLEIFLNLLVFGFGPRCQRVIGGVRFLSGTVRAAAAVLVLFFVQRLSFRLFWLKCGHISRHVG